MLVYTVEVGDSSEEFLEAVAGSEGAEENTLHGEENSLTI